MKRIWIILICALCLSGCSSTQVMETISDDLAVSAQAVASRVEISLPAEEDATVLSADDGSKLYLCEDYVVTVQTLSGGDLERSVQAVTGFEKDSLTVIKTDRDGLVSYECAWCAAGEGTDQVCRTVILDDGTYHYAVTVMADYTQAGALNETWQAVLDSVALSTD